jgi:hypothetical protein
MISIMAQNNSDISTQWTYTMMNTQNSTTASMWGGNMDLSQITTDPQGQTALMQNVMFTRLAMAANQQYITPDGGFNPDISQGMSVPVDPTKLVASNGTSTSSSSSMPYSYGTSTSTSAPSVTTTSSSSAASRSVGFSGPIIFAAAAIAALVL